MTGKLLARYPLFRLPSPRQLHDWLAAKLGQATLGGSILAAAE